MAELFRMIRAELYKAVRRPYFALTMLFTALSGFGVAFLLSYLKSYNSGAPEHVNFVLAAYSSLFGMSAGLMLVAIGGDMVFSEQYKNNTLKNEVSFGLRRCSIYLSRWIVTLLVMLLVFLVLAGTYLLGCLALLGLPGDETALAQFGMSAAEALRTSLAYLGYYTLTSLPLWMGGMSCVLCFYFLIPNSTFAALAYVLGVVGTLPSLLQALGDYVSRVFTTIYRLTLVYPFDILNRITPGTSFDMAFTGRAWLIGLGWTLLTTVIGISVFSRKEIK